MRKRPVGRPAAGERGASREEILDAAVLEFGLNGFDGASIRAIGERVGVTHGTIYFYFTSKAELYRAAYHKALAFSVDYFVSKIPAGANLNEALGATFDAAAELVEHQRHLSMLALRYRTDFGRVEELGAERPGRSFVFLDDLVRQAVERGEISQADAPALMEAVSATFWGITLVGVRDARALRLTVDGFKRLIDRGASGGRSVELSPPQSATRTP